MSNTEKSPDAAAIDASISVLGEDEGEAKVASIETTAGAQGPGSVERADTGRQGAQENLEAPIRESDGAGRAADGASVERPGSDPDLI
ncbi:hypothetical protein ASG43_11385 [Aureimonas sp. Leaf454]|uniref:hypothetical protein n=1 Tax=Aureimonas sp. Leaf454 TaxID=1736381 RepID=UPI0006F88984|nr:hypothetical protein [Aureimonas sp. Leaf454]KQT46234.1 hypothetical protein ASG43_11385 [Aureimonas sp. Leaf454]